MQIKLFTIPIIDAGVMLEEMNKFLRANKILETETHLVQNERGAFWCFCVKYLEQSNANTYSVNKEKIDYRQILDEPTFVRFSKLRETRKKIANEEAIPAYAVFTDEELAGIAKLDHLSISSICSIKGIGEKRAEKYGEKMITSMKAEQMQ